MGTVHTIPESALDYVMYGDKSNIVSNYLQSQMQNMAKFVNPLTDRIYAAMQSSYNYVNDSLVKTGILSSLRSTGVAVTDDFFAVLTTVEDFRTANTTMQRWIMAQPTIRQHYLDQNADGYSDTYQNVFGKEVGEDDYNYRMVMSGVVVDTDEHTSYSMYHDSPYPGDRRLTYEEKMTVLSTWDHLQAIMDSSVIDFTHQTNSNARINK